MDAAAVHKRLQAELGPAVKALSSEGHEPSIEIDPAMIDKACALLKEEDDFHFEHLSNLTGVDYPDENVIRVVYHLHSYKHGTWFTLKVAADRDNPHVATVERVYPTANWHEREAFDLLGVVFDGHSDLRRILMPEDWEGYPLRKDFKEPSHYHGISTVRESMLTITRN